ncbi:MAG: hypothetical protein N2C14_26460, partial [Planctomycetales bacterium]
MLFRTSVVVRTAVLVAVCLAGPHESRAEVVVDVAGVNGAGFSTWTFSGSDTAVSDSNSFAGNNNVRGGSNGWNNVGGGWSGVSGISGNIAPTSGAAAVTVNGTSANLTRVRYGNNLDGFLGFASDHATNFPLNDGDAVSWTGTLAFPIDVNTLSSFSGADEFASLDLDFNVRVLNSLVIDVTGDPGSGTSTWTFSGGDNSVSDSNSFAGNNNVSGGSNGWNNLGDWSGIGGLTGNIAPTWGSATVTVNGVTADLTRARYGNNAAGFIGFASDNVSNFALNDGDAVTWAGSLEFPIDVNNL